MHFMENFEKIRVEPMFLVDSLESGVKDLLYFAAAVKDTWRCFSAPYIQVRF